MRLMRILFSVVLEIWSWVEFRRSVSLLIGIERKGKGKGKGFIVIYVDVEYGDDGKREKVVFREKYFEYVCQFVRGDYDFFVFIQIVCQYQVYFVYDVKQLFIIVNIGIVNNF